MISIEDFAKMELKVGKVLEVQDHPNADKLYVLKVDIGEKQIQLVAGIRKHYTPEQLAGKLIAVIVNLEPKPLRGVESQGMLLAAQGQDIITILSPENEVKPGSVIR